MFCDQSFWNVFSYSWFSSDVCFVTMQMALHGIYEFDWKIFLSVLQRKHHVLLCLNGTSSQLCLQQLPYFIQTDLLTCKYIVYSWLHVCWRLQHAQHKQQKIRWNHDWQVFYSCLCLLFRSRVWRGPHLSLCPRRLKRQPLKTPPPPMNWTRPLPPPLWWPQPMRAPRRPTLHSRLTLRFITSILLMRLRYNGTSTNWNMIVLLT